MSIIVEFLLEFLLQFFGELILDLLIHLGWRIRVVNQVVTKLFNAGVCFGVGLFIGFVSLLVFPHAFVQSESLHGISFIVTPVLAGLAMAAIGWIRERQGKLVVRLETFSYAFALAFGMALIRFYFTY